MSELLSFGFLVVLTTGLTEVLKRAIKMPTRFVPLTALVLGLILGVVAEFSLLGLVTGVAIGLSSCGLFDQKLILGK